MDASRSGSSYAAPVPVASPSSAATLTRFYFQSFGKKVSEVETLFPVSTGRGSSAEHAVAPHSVLKENSPLDVSAQTALKSAIPGAVACAADPAFSESALIHAAALEATCIRRIAAVDRYPIHRAYPSPRGMFGADVELTTPGVSPNPLRLDPVSRTLSPVPGRERDAAADRQTLSITTHPDRYPAPYGTLRPSLALLEAGHLLATLSLTLQQAGLRVKTTFGANAATGSDDSQPVTAGRLDIHGRRTDIADASLSARAPRTVDDSAAAALAMLASRGGLLDPSGRAPGSLKEWLDRRSSGLSKHNLVTSGPIDESVSRFLCELFEQSLAQVAHLFPHQDALRLFQLSLENDDLSSKRVLEVSRSGSAPVQGAGGFEAPFSSGSGFIWCIDFPAWVRRYGADADVVVHTLLGWLCQWGCLGAAAAGHTARPARNFDEAEWAAALRLPLNHTPAYQLWLRRPGHDETRQNVWTMQGSSQ